MKLSRASANEVSCCSMHDKCRLTCREKDPDPDGEQLAATQDPLGEAMKLVQRLRQHSGDRLGTHKLACNVYLRRHRLLLALKAVNNAIALEGVSHPDVHSMVVRTCSAAEASSSGSSSSPEADTASKPQQVGRILNSTRLSHTSFSRRSHARADICPCSLVRDSLRIVMACVHVPVTIEEPAFIHDFL